MAAPTFDSVCKAGMSASTAGATKTYLKAFQLWVNHGPQAGATLNGNGKDVLGFLKLAQKGAPEFTKQFLRSLNV